MNPVTSLTASASAAVLFGKHLKRPQPPPVDKSNPFIGYFNKSSSSTPPQRVLPRPKPVNKQYGAPGRQFKEILTSKHACDSSTSLRQVKQAPFEPKVTKELPTSPLTSLPFLPLRFELEFKHIRVLGKGGQGSVVEVESKNDHKKYAIKKVKVQGKEGRDRNRLLTQSLREVHLMANLPRHPNIVRYYTSWLEEEHSIAPKSIDDDGDEESIASEDYVSFDGSCNSCGIEFESADEIASENSLPTASPFAVVASSMDTSPSINLYIQMELCKQTESISNLASWLRSTGEDRVKTRAGHAMAMQLFTDVVRGVKHIHSYGVIHRDIKPDNIFLQNGVAKIGDFGLSKHMHETEDGPLEFSPSPSPTAPSSSSPDAANHTTALGTFLYASPEQVGRGESSLPKASFYSEKSDIFALGVMLLELCSSFSTIMERVQVLTAVRHGVVPAQAQVAFPTEMSLVTKMTALDPKDRPSADDIFQLLSPTWGGVMHSLHDKTWSRRRKMQLDQF
ncbi:eukaryotic translation initiation factor 2-alpha kinase [Thraustotheca clavata]|uniref:non-specific serine/threonine protein kinase n=1 Tax=Thraustotheca clavata TaxID=74557 RepID=A0A1V9ZES2_9STRA|nr:eukaryotic translation initiation factor 2-alpha kinase [Thraustotheca clavata]